MVERKNWKPIAGALQQNHAPGLGQQADICFSADYALTY